MIRTLIALAVLAGCAVLASACAKSQAAGRGSGKAQPGLTTKYFPSRLPAGPLVVSELPDLLPHDTARNKDLPVAAYFPEAAGRYPLIIFSHGAGGDKDGGAELMRYWAAFGFVVLCPTHQDSLKLRWEHGERPSMLDTIRSFSQDPEFRLSRIEDVKFLIDCAIGQTGLPPEVLARIDPQRIGVGGHSAGAMTASLLAGARAKLPGSEDYPDLSNPRIACALLLSGQGVGGAGFREDSWQPMTMPVMVLTGSEDTAEYTGQTPQTRRQPYELAPAGDKYLVFIQDALHMSFTGKAAEIAREYYTSNAVSPRTNLEMQVVGLSLDQVLAADQEGIFDDVKLASLNFWQAYLNHDAAAAAWLKSDSLVKTSTVRVEYEFK